MNLSIQTTIDGSQTVLSEHFGETYHSINGAITESVHVFIQLGLNESKAAPVTVFETGFGTGLNALLTALEAEKQQRRVVYHSIELYPLAEEMYSKLDYTGIVPHEKALFDRLHQSVWEEEIVISPFFSLKKIHGNLLECNYPVKYDVVYFDAFSPAVQPELWEATVFEKLYAAMHPGGVLTTYCARGQVRRNLQSVGFVTERLPGPPGKREMLRAKVPV